MKWSLRIGRIFGIDLYLHFTFLLFLGLIWYVTRTQPGGGVQQSLMTLAFFLSAFTCVVLHEYGHALTARRYGIATRDITLLPIGGVARLERMPSDPKQELLVAIAGPAVNLAIAIVLYGVCLALGINPLVRADAALSGRADFLITLLWWNLIMIAFNMLPAFPMDGGRVLRAVLAMRMEYAKATRWAATVGKAMALIFAWFAIFYDGSPMLILIAFFVWMGAGAEAADAERKTMLSGVRVRDAMVVDSRRLSPEETAGTVAQLILQGWQTDFPVTFDGNVIGLVTRQDVIAGLNVGQTVSVQSFMRQQVPSCSPNEELQGVLERMKEADLPLMPVMDNGRLAGLVTAENTVEFILFRRALERRSN